MYRTPSLWFAVAALAACNEQGFKSEQEVPATPKPDILVDPPALAYAALPIGASATLPFTVTNVGDAALDVTAIAVTLGDEAFSLVPANFAFTLAPAETETFEVTYSPPTAETWYGAVQVASNDPDGDNASVQLLGEGLAPDIRVEPALLEYTDVPRGSTERRTFTVRNIGAAPLTVSDVVLADGDAFVVEGPVFSFELAPGDTMDVDVAFSPSGAGLDEGRVQVISDDPDGDHSSVDLRGTGLQPDLEIQPSAHDFGEAVVPCGDVVTLTLSNVGGDDLVIDDLGYASAGGTLALEHAHVLPLTLAPGASTTVDVRWTPVTDGDDVGTLTVASNDPDGDEVATQDASALYVASQSESFAAPLPPPVDVLITIDQSCSMEQDNQDDVEQGFPLFLDELQLVSDWRLLLVTKTDGCTTTGVMDAATVNEQALIDGAFVAAHNDNGGANVTEKLLQLTDLALSKTGPGQCNQGFLRPGALLHVVTLSDEPEQSGQAASYWVNRFEGYVTDPALLKVSGVLDLFGTCGLGANGYTDAVNLTGGASLDICDPSWGSDFTDIASEVLPIVPVYALAAPADPSTLVVTVNGVPTGSFSYDAALQEVTIAAPAIEDGDVVDIDYAVLATCP